MFRLSGSSRPAATIPTPALEQYTSGGTNNPGTPNGPNKQGLGAFYQLLPYLEQNAVKGLTNQDKLQSTIIPLYNCPSRRAPLRVQTKTNGDGAQLTDYATAQPATDYCGGSPYVPLDAWPFSGPSPGFAIRSYWCGENAATAGSWGTDIERMLITAA